MYCIYFITIKLKGGAVYVNGAADISDCSGSNNQAQECTTIYQTVGTCYPLSI